MGLHLTTTVSHFSIQIVFLSSFFFQLFSFSARKRTVLVSRVVVRRRRQRHERVAGGAPEVGSRSGGHLDVVRVVIVVVVRFIPLVDNVVVSIVIIVSPANRVGSGVDRSLVAVCCWKGVVALVWGMGASARHHPRS